MPASLHNWIRAQLDKKLDKFECVAFEKVKGSFHFSAKLMPCFNQEEYLLLLEKHSGDWNLDSVKTSLGLTSREAEILMWISRGKTNKEIGLILDTSPRTVNKHLEHIFEKLGVVTRAAAISVVMQRSSNLSFIAEGNVF